MRIYLLVALLLLPSLGMAQSNHLSISAQSSQDDSSSNNQQAPIRQHSSYMIAPGVSVTQLYEDAQNTISTYSSESTQSSANPATDNSASYSQPSYSQPSYSQPSYSQPVSIGSSELPYYSQAPTSSVSAVQYTPSTSYDNMQNRFYMQQNGQKMTANDFDQWMKNRGIRIAGGKP